MEALSHATGKVCKSLGRAIDSMGVKMQGKKEVVEECLQFTKPITFLVCPSCRVQTALYQKPNVSEACFVATSASVSGNVTMGRDSSAWYGVTIRGTFLASCANE